MLKKITRAKIIDILVNYKIELINYYQPIMKKDYQRIDYNGKNHLNPYMPKKLQKQKINIKQSSTGKYN